MTHRPWFWLGMLAAAAALLVAGNAPGSARADGSPEHSTVRKSICLASIPFNGTRGLFRGNPALRRAVSWALDRTDFVAGSDTETPWTHFLPPGVPGSITNARLQPYGTRSNIAKAREIAAGHFRDGRITVYYSSSGTTGPIRAENVRRDLINLGFDPARITMRGFAAGQFYVAISRRGSAWDLAVSEGVCEEEPASFVLYPSWYFPKNQKYLRKIKAARRLSGRARNKAVGKLDLEIARNLAPAAVMAFRYDR